MSLISRDVDYAVRALVYMEQHKGQLVSTAELEGALELPRPFMRKVLQRLEAQGVVRSVKGNRGGFILAKDPEDINVGLLVNSLQGGLGFGDCKFNKKPCPQMKSCQIHSKLQAIEKKVLDELTAVNIAGLLR